MHLHFGGAQSKQAPQRQRLHLLWGSTRDLSRPLRGGKPAARAHRPPAPQAELTHPPRGAGEVVRLCTLRVPAVRPSPGVHSADTFQSRSCARCVREPPVHPTLRQFAAGSLGIYSGGRCCSPTSRARLVCILSSPAPPRETLLAQPSLPSDAHGGWMDDATRVPV